MQDLVTRYELEAGGCSSLGSAQLHDSTQLSFCSDGFLRHVDYALLLSARVLPVPGPVKFPDIAPKMQP